MLETMIEGFKKTDIGQIPVDWDVDIVDNIFDIKQGKSVSKKNRIGSNQKSFLRTANVFWNRLDLSELDAMNFTQEEELKYRLRKNDILVCEGGDIGRTALLKEELNSIYYQNHLHRLRAKNDKIIPTFFVYWMLYCMQFTNYYKGIGNTSTIPNLSQSRLKHFKFPIPSKKEQNNIVNVLSLIQDSLDKHKIIKQNLQELKKALMQKLFTEGLNSEPLKNTEIGKIPESWEVVELGTKYLFSSKSVKSKISEFNEIPFIPMDLIPLDSFICDKYNIKSITELTSGTYVENGDLLISKITPSFENGKQSVLQIPFNFGYATTEVIPIKPIIDISSLGFLYYYLKIPKIRQSLAGKMEGSTGRQRLSKNILEKTLMPFPSYSEQENITEVFLKLDDRISILKYKINILSDLFKTILNQLMSGKIRVKDIQI